MIHRTAVRTYCCRRSMCVWSTVAVCCCRAPINSTTVPGTATTLQFRVVRCSSSVDYGVKVLRYMSDEPRCQHATAACKRQEYAGRTAQHAHSHIHLFGSRRQQQAKTKRPSHSSNAEPSYRFAQAKTFKARSNFGIDFSKARLPSATTAT